MAAAVRKKWEAGQRVIGYWQWTNDPQISELLSRSGADVGLLDCQHGMLGRDSMYNLIRAMKTHDCIAGVRVPSIDPEFIGSALDHGAELLVCPLVNSKHEAEQFCQAAHYPPNGFRSFGPGRSALGMNLQDYFDSTLPTHMSRPLLFAMIETVEGLKNVDEICSVSMLDGILIGPYDLSVAMLEPLQPHKQTTTNAIKTIAKSCAKHGKKLSIYSPSAKSASFYANGNGKFGKDFDLLFAFHDTDLLHSRAVAEVDELKRQPYQPDGQGANVTAGYARGAKHD